MARTKKKDNIISYSGWCPLNLDTLIMSDRFSAGEIERNLGVLDDTMMSDCIKRSACAPWILRIGVLDGFSAEFRKRVFRHIASFNPSSVSYLLHQIDAFGRKDLSDEIENAIEDQYVKMEFKNFSPLTNPYSRMNNPMKMHDQKVVEGDFTVRHLLLDRIQEFLRTSDKECVDFSGSIFLVEMLNPRFFDGITEAEHMVLMKNIGKYIHVLSSSSYSKNRPNTMFPPLVLLKHVLSSDKFTMRVRYIAWQELFNTIVNDPEAESYHTMTKIAQMFNLEDVVNSTSKMFSTDDEYQMHDIYDILSKSNNLFGEFEIECALRGLNSADYFPMLLNFPQFFPIAKDMVEFQDDSTKDKMFKGLGELLRESM